MLAIQKHNDNDVLVALQKAYAQVASPADQGHVDVWAAISAIEAADLTTAQRALERAVSGFGDGFAELLLADLALRHQRDLPRARAMADAAVQRAGSADALVTHFGRQILGIVELEEGNQEAAGRELLRSLNVDNMKALKFPSVSIELLERLIERGLEPTACNEYVDRILAEEGLDPGPLFERARDNLKRL